MSTLRLGVLASGTGSNFEAVADAIDAGTLDAQIVLLICNRPGAKALAKAEARGIPVATMDHKDAASREDYDASVGDALLAANVELVVMAGFDRIITDALLERFPGKILNIHPALLPAFKGLDAQTQAAEYGVRIAGATVHIVDAAMDHGPIVAQAAVPAFPGEPAEDLRLRILAQEHRLYPAAIQLFAEGRVKVDGRRVIVQGDSAGGASDALVSPKVSD